MCFQVFIVLIPCDRKMKFASIAFIVLLTTMSNPGFGQAGLSVGSNLSSARNSESDTDPVIRPRAGIFFELPISGRFTLRPSILYSSKGYFFERKSNGRKFFENNIRVDYLEIPVNVMVSVGDIFGGNLSISAGPYFAYGFGGQFKSKLFSGSREVPIDGNIIYEKKITLQQATDGQRLYYKRVDLGLSIGLHYGFEHLSFHLQYGEGLRSFVPEPLDFDSDSKLYFRTLSLSVGYK